MYRSIPTAIYPPQTMAIQIWQPGDKIKNDRFEITQILGEGGFGITYLAKDKKRNQQVVIKTPNEYLQRQSDFEEEQDKFIDEGFKLRGFKHPYIIKVYEQIKIGDIRGLVMEYIPGQNLKDYVCTRGRLNETEALLYIDQIAQALDCVHQENVFHRDVHPENIMKRQDRDEVVLIDFGIAKEFFDTTFSVSNSHGREIYKPVEQYDRKGRFGAYTDIYALAATSYYLLAGSSPLFKSNWRKENRHNEDGIKGEEFLWGKLVKIEVSEKTQAAIKAGMGIEPSERPQTVTEFRNLLGLLRPVVNLPPHIINGFTEKLGEEIKIEMVDIPSGEFWMGSSDEEFSYFLNSAKKDLKWSDKQVEDFLKVYDERPRHLVAIKAGYMSKHQITQVQYEYIMGNNPSSFSGSKYLPVDSISWDDAIEFCQKLSKKVDKNYTLPTESQWEYACRAGTYTPFYFDSSISPKMANYNCNYIYANQSQEEYPYRRETTPVGNFQQPNRFGLHDMHGNLREWCLDSWHKNYDGAPLDGSAWINVDDKQYMQERLLRGGSWSNAPRDCRSAYRYKNKASFRHNCNGFRIWLSTND
jgi:formylglycine-generating enzyme required for sulfatase activity